MSGKAKIAAGVLVLVLVLAAAGYMLAAPSSASAQAAIPVTTPPAPTPRVVIGTYADGSPVYATGTSADKSAGSVAERARIAATKDGQS